MGQQCIKYDSFFHCEACQCVTKHQCTAYPDAEYRVCTKCGCRTTWGVNEVNRLEETGHKKDDKRWRDDLDFKRNADRKYKKRGES